MWKKNKCKHHWHFEYEDRFIEGCKEGAKVNTYIRRCCVCNEKHRAYA